MIKRTPHPQDCTGCKHEMTWAIVVREQKRTPTKGQCLHPHRGEWPHGCRHYVERAR